MKEIIRLSPGQPVLFKYPKEFNKHDDVMDYLKRGHISCEETQDAYYVKGFVVGDDDEHGISVVALDNPLICLTATREFQSKELRDMHRELLRSQGYYANELRDKLGIKSIKTMFSPVCGFQ